MDNELVIFEDDEIKLEVPISAKDETVWLNRQQMATLFDRDIKTIGKHIKNAINEELSGTSTVAKFATVQLEGMRQVERLIEYYNLNVIISVGYRVKSKRGVAFRKWANSVLKEYIIKGYAINQQRLNQLNQVLSIMKRLETALDAKQVLTVVERYNKALDLLDDYDHQKLEKPKGNKTTYILTYEECRKVIDEMKFSSDSKLFGNEKDDSFKGSIGNIYQSFAGVDIYPSLEEKAANLLYFVTKNHSFSDGNKRIAATMFLYFLDRNGVLFTNHEKLIDDHTLVALVIMIAESRPEEKDVMISIIMNCIS
ncbi:phosphoribosylaminoimidazolesuccinocarboxamide synthase [Phascolarctobacterium succinatutens CAG:287]|uniref:Phosphoribosylaminoimidazolesuccinocarboxamide synthase n=1 Tax=Phascolarctobacterium succinatutens CAG:287 TaxID=1263101 RepID=R6WJ68_9FIRM|nr:virulence protein RhuM/Fic/DOC family protein [Phascolarctobacterium succinatutens]CDD09445.1 phosphoribosylaminoimidazolesuccinocarboxamide synthase [Phascolarctobacterium succinatutens CAG:287]